MLLILLDYNWTMCLTFPVWISHWCSVVLPVHRASRHKLRGHPCPWFFSRKARRVGLFYCGVPKNNFRNLYYSKSVSLTIGRSGAGINRTNYARKFSSSRRSALVPLSPLPSSLLCDLCINIKSHSQAVGRLFRLMAKPNSINIRSRYLQITHSPHQSGLFTCD